jgi:gliding motility-associated-like protein
MMEQCNCEVFLPNAFSPNGDGINDEFRAYAACDRVEGFRLTVFDRWGSVVFTTTDFNQAWDGTMSNNLCITGVYIWQVAYVEAVNGRLYEKSKKGSVVLLK